MLKTKKAQVTLYITFMIVAIVIVLIAAFLAPFGVLLNTELYAAGEDIMLMANESIENIHNTTVKESVRDMLSVAMAAQENNIEINSDIFQYGWIFVVALTAIIVFISARKLVEFGQVGGGFV